LKGLIYLLLFALCYSCFVFLITTIQYTGAQEFDNSPPSISSDDGYIDDPFNMCPVDPNPNKNDPPLVQRPDAEGRDISGNTTLFVIFCDPEKDYGKITFKIVMSPSHGKIVFNNEMGDRLQYTADPGYVGEDRFSWKVNDGSSDSKVVTELLKIPEPELAAVPSEDQSPNAVAGPNQEVYEGDVVRLDGSASSDSDGSIEKYHWELEESDDNTADPLLSNSESAFSDFVAPEINSPFTTYLFELTVTDNSGFTGDNYITITVKDKTNGDPSTNQSNTEDRSNTPQIPSDEISLDSIANAGPDQQVNEGDIVYLNGSASRNSPYGSITSFLWTQMEGFPSITLINPNTNTPRFTAPELTTDTTYKFELTVEDESGYSYTDEVNILVNDAQTSE
jgi:hypothetical protein